MRASIYALIQRQKTYQSNMGNQEATNFLRKNPDATLLWMLVPLMTTAEKTPSLTGYYHVHVEPKDAIVILELDMTFFALKGYHIKMNPPH